MIALGRRAVLAGSAASLTVLSTPAAGLAARSPLLERGLVTRGRLRDPFTLGVASGDPEPDGVVIWTRLAPQPLAWDGRGGMPSREVRVDWQVATDAQFAQVVRQGAVRALPRWAHSVHVEVAGLEPAREYFYRFRAEGHLSPVGRTRTAPAYDSSPASFTVAAASCAEYEHGYFTAYRRLVEDDPDLVLHLGDYLYEFRHNGYVASPHNVRRTVGPETVTLAGYRQRHAQYKTDPDLQLAHAAAPWSVVWDDHEVDGNWAGLDPAHHQHGFRRRRMAAFQAYYENMPLRRSSMPRGAGMQIYRRVRWGDLATVHLLDTRQYRDDQACGDRRTSRCRARLAPGRSITGDRQERWLLRGLGDSGARWDVVAQQVFFAQHDTSRRPGRQVGMDAWDGYAASRQRILEGFEHRGVRNPVVLTGDVHRHYANELRLDFDRPATRPIGVELVTTSVTSGGNGSDATPAMRAERAVNPHIKYSSSRRGYLLTSYTRSTLQADFTVLPYVRRPGAPARTDASYVVEDRDPVLHRA
ncbi:alkaline phosphatase D family protein [Nocardioides sp.]|uniref:alkaline phosphatase D family protein n=1 Tax=Nocardioides sp. TaxID=35761 RepID=UPI002EDA58EA